MATLTPAELKAATRLFVAAADRNRESIGCLKADLQAAINALDQWIDANATAINQAIPQPARSALTTSQKARIVAYVALRRDGG